MNSFWLHVAGHIFVWLVFIVVYVPTYFLTGNYLLSLSLPFVPLAALLLYIARKL